MKTITVSSSKGQHKVVVSANSFKTSVKKKMLCSFFDLNPLPQAHLWHLTPEAEKGCTNGFCELLLCQWTNRAIAETSGSLRNLCAGAAAGLPAEVPSPAVPSSHPQGSQLSLAFASRQDFSNATDVSSSQKHYLRLKLA